MIWRVPLSDLSYDLSETQKVLEVLESRWLTMGAMTAEFELRFAQECGVRHAVALSNATVALHLALLALGLGPGDEVIVPSLTFVATANAVRYTGATPVFADIVSLNNFGISPKSIESAISSRTKAIIPVHYAGYICDMQTILDIASRNDVAIVEDAAHAPGASLGGKKAGSFGDAGCFSFFSNKNLATGEGGMLTTDRDDIAEKARMLRSHGMSSMTWDRHKGHAYSYDVLALGYNYRLDEIRAALGIEQLKKLDLGNNRRREISEEYSERLAQIEHISLPYRDHPGLGAAHIYPLLLDRGISRSHFIQCMREKGVQTSIHYPPVHHFTAYASDCSCIPLTEDVGEREVTIPLFPTMTQEQIDTVILSIAAAIAGSTDG